MELNFVLFLGSRIWESIPNPPLTFFLVSLGAGLTLYTYKSARRIHEEGKFDKNLWDRIVTLVQQNRLRDASALCEIEEGVFARVYKAGIDAARFSRQDSGDNMTLIIQERIERLRRGLLPTAAASGLIVLTSVVVAIERLSEFALIQSKLAPIANALLYITLPALVAGALIVPAAGLFFYCIYKLIRLSSKMNSYRLRLLVALFERAARSAMDPFATKVLTNPGIPTDKMAPAQGSEQQKEAVASAVTPKEKASAPGGQEKHERVPEPYYPNANSVWPENAFQTLNGPAATSTASKPASAVKAPAKKTEPAFASREQQAANEGDAWDNVHIRS